MPHWGWHPVRWQRSHLLGGHHQRLHQRHRLSVKKPHWRSKGRTARARGTRQEPGGGEGCGDTASSGACPGQGGLVGTGRSYRGSKEGWTRPWTRSVWRASEGRGQRGAWRTHFHPAHLTPGSAPPLVRGRRPVAGTAAGGPGPRLLCLPVWAHPFPSRCEVGSGCLRMRSECVFDFTGQILLGCVSHVHNDVLCCCIHT